MNFWPKLKLRRINLKHAIVIVHPCESINVRRGAFGFQRAQACIIYIFEEVTRNPIYLATESLVTLFNKF